MAQPGKSLVIKAPQPTSAQRARVASLRPAPRPAPRPIPSNGPATPWTTQTPSRQAQPPIRVNDQGFVANPAANQLVRGVKPAATGDSGFAPKKAPKVVVKIHPNGHIEIQHTASAAPASAPAAPASSAVPASPTKKASARVPAALPIAPAPVQTLQQQAQQLLAPAIAAATDPINARIAAQQAAITGSTQELAELMGKYGPASKAIYGGAQQGQAAVDSATGATLAGQGQSGQDALAAKLAAIDADPATAARLNATAAGNVTGTSGALAAHGSSALSDLISRDASAQDMGAKLPGVAGELGLQATRTAQKQGTTDLANAMSTIEAQYPNVVNQIQTNKTQQKQLNFEHGVALLQAGGKVTPQIKALLGGALPTGTTTVAAKTAARTAATATTKAAATANKVNLPLSKEYKILVNADGDPVLKNGKLVALPGSTTDGLSVKDFKKYKSEAKAGAILAHNGGQDAKGNTLPPISWLQYRQHGLAAGIPEEILIATGKTVYSPREIKLGLIPGQGSDKRGG